MKKFCVMLMFTVIFTGTALADSYTDRYGNDGSSWNTAYVIGNAEDFMTAAQNDSSNKYYRLSGDIELASPSKWESSTSSFKGYFDGQGFTITIKYGSVLFNRVASYGYSLDSSLMRLNVISRTETSGGIVRYLESGTIESCSFAGRISTSGSSAGGIASSITNSRGIIRNCVFSGLVSAKYSGGIVGYMSGGTVESCDAAYSRITGTGESGSSAGGIAGEMRGGTITGCKSEASVSGAQYNGGIVGRAYSGVSMSDIYGNTYPEGYYEVGSNTHYNFSSENDDEEDSGTSHHSSGCSAGMNILMLSVIPLVFRKR